MTWRDVWPPYSLLRWNRAGGIVLFLDARRILRQASENCAIRITSRINSYRSSDASLPDPVSKLSWTNGNQSSWLKLFSSFRIHRKSQSNSSKTLWWIDFKGSAFFLSSTSTRRFRMIVVSVRAGELKYEQLILMSHLWINISWRCCHLQSIVFCFPRTKLKMARIIARRFRNPFIFWIWWASKGTKRERWW